MTKYHQFACIDIKDQTPGTHPSCACFDHVRDQHYSFQLIEVFVQLPRSRLHLTNERVSKMWNTH